MGTLTCFVNPFSDSYRLVDEYTKREFRVPASKLVETLYRLYQNKQYTKVWFEGPYAESEDIINKFDNRYPDCQLIMEVN